MKLWIRYYMSTWSMSWVPLHLSPNTGSIASAHIYRLGCIPSTTMHKDRAERLEADSKHTDVIYILCHAVKSENTEGPKQHSSLKQCFFFFFFEIFRKRLIFRLSEGILLVSLLERCQKLILHKYFLNHLVMILTYHLY